jgi:hypothetical protein
VNLVSIAMLLWLTGLVAGYWALPRELQLHWVSLVTAVFLSIYAPLSLAALVIVTTACYFIGHRSVGAALAVCILMLLGYRALSFGKPCLSGTRKDSPHNSSY